MPLSKERQAEYMRAYRKSVIPKSSTVIPKSSTVIPNSLPWYAGAEDHFGTVRSKHYAKAFFETLGSRDE